jgi:NOL1/NOP2/fmu family ribosome biogenesis protein
MGVEDAWNYFEERFGVSREDLDGYKILKRSGDFWLVSDVDELELEYQTEGVRFLRDTGNFLKPTTYGLQIIEGKISRNLVELDREEFLDLLDGEMVERNLEENADSSEESACSSNPEECCEGYVALVYDGKIFGCGLYKDELVSSRIPKGRGKELRDLL